MHLNHENKCRNDKDLRVSLSSLLANIPTEDESRRGRGDVAEVGYREVPVGVGVPVGVVPCLLGATRVRWVYLWGKKQLNTCEHGTKRKVRRTTRMRDERF